MILLLIGAFHALQIGHLGAPGIAAGAGAVHAGLGVVARAGRPHRVADTAVVGEDLILHRLHRLADGFPGSGGDLIHRGVDQCIGRGTVLLVIFQIGVGRHGLCLPGLLGRTGADIAANGPQLVVGDAHQAVHQVQCDVFLQALPPDVQVRQGDGVAGAEEPAQAVFLFRRDQGGVGTAHGHRTAGHGSIVRCQCCRSTQAEHRRQHQRRSAAHKPLQLFHEPFLLIMRSVFL